MNEITVLIYFICFAVVFGATFAFMWRMMTITLKDFDRVKTIHPELRDVKPGEELLVFKVKEEILGLVGVQVFHLGSQIK